MRTGPFWRALASISFSSSRSLFLSRSSSTLAREYIFSFSTCLRTDRRETHVSIAAYRSAVCLARSSGSLRRNVGREIVGQESRHCVAFIEPTIKDTARIARCHPEHKFAELSSPLHLNRARIPVVEIWLESRRCGFPSRRGESIRGDGNTFVFSKRSDVQDKNVSGRFNNALQMQSTMNRASIFWNNYKSWRDLSHTGGF